MTISPAKANHLYWLGRYAERVSAQMHFLRHHYDLCLDEGHEDAIHDYCNKLNLPACSRDRDAFLDEHSADGAEKQQKPDPEIPRGKRIEKHKENDLAEGTKKSRRALEQTNDGGAFQQPLELSLMEKVPLLHGRAVSDIQKKAEQKAVRQNND